MAETRVLQFVRWLPGSILPGRRVLEQREPGASYPGSCLFSVLRSLFSGCSVGEGLPYYANGEYSETEVPDLVDGQCAQLPDALLGLWTGHLGRRRDCRYQRCERRACADGPTGLPDLRKCAPL